MTSRLRLYLAVRIRLRGEMRAAYCLPTLWTPWTR